MKHFLAVAIAMLSLTACATATIQNVSLTTDPRYTSVGIHNHDVPKIAWYTHSQSMAGVRIVTMLGETDKVPTKLVTVRKSISTITVCYSVISGAVPSEQESVRPTRVDFRISGIPRNDKRKVVASRTCGKKV